MYCSFKVNAFIMPPITSYLMVELLINLDNFIGLIDNLLSIVLLLSPVHDHEMWSMDNDQWFISC